MTEADTTTGFAGGIEAGANMQSGNIVYGVAVDYGALNLSASRGASILLPFGNFGGLPVTIGSSIETDWLFTARGRIGWAERNVLIYATGGLALTRLTVANSYWDFVTGSESASRSELKAGLTVGSGVEYALDNHWTIKGEYLFVYFDDVSVTGNIVSSDPLDIGTANPLSVSEDLRVHLLRVGYLY